jgi:hypothetical protein
MWLAKAAAVWLALMAGTIVGGMLIPMPPTTGAADGPLTLGIAILLVNALFALLFAALASRMPGALWRRAGALFLLLFGTETLLSTIESVYFAEYLHLPDGLLAGVAGINAVKSASAALVAGLLWRPAGPPPPMPIGLVWKLPAIALAYVVFYFGAGELIAWQSAAVRTYYGDGLEIDRTSLALFQVGRGLIWAGLALVAACTLRGPTRAISVLIGAAFAIFMAAPLLYPNELMPWSVRSVHLLEISSSNLLFGALAMIILALSPGMRLQPRNA